MAQTTCIASAENRKIVTGSLAHVAVEVKGYLKKHPEAVVTVFSNATGKVIDLDLRGTTKAISKRYTEQTDSNEQGTKDEKQQGRKAQARRSRPRGDTSASALGLAGYSAGRCVS
ncbi:MAG TPA: DUF2239 family protein [Bdellovibrionota bacterium]|nr:DUF2239 family protein [Bdellovibrionota bacterium]